MDKKKIRNYQIFSVIFIFVLGNLLHFTYELSGKNEFVAVFSAVNESTWEHLKLLFFPMILTTIIGYLYLGKEYPNFLCSKILGTIIAICFIVIFFYTYTGIVGMRIPVIDIISFFIATIIGELLSYIFIINKFKCKNIASLIILIILFICFIVFTYNTPKIGLFKDPITGKYGIK